MATREAFDAAMESNDVAWLIQNTFLARVPELVAGGMSIQEAIIAAKQREDDVSLTMIAPQGYWQQEAVAELRSEMCRRVYKRANELAPAEPKVNPRWLECEKELGRKITALDFIMWCNKKRQEAA